MTKPIDISTRATASFVAAHLPPGAAVLEVGCGEGHVARDLLDRGHRIVAVDSDTQAVVRARARGVAAERASWPDYRSRPVDAVVFTRSLHHIRALGEALAAARELSGPRGRVLVEDFAFDAVDAAALAWFRTILESPAGRALLLPRPGEVVTDLLASEESAAQWHRHHDHGLHTAEAMTRAVSEYFVPKDVRSVPYLFRYLIPVLPETPAAAAFVEEVFREETRLGESGQLVLIGRRIVGTAVGRAPESLAKGGRT